MVVSFFFFTRASGAPYVCMIEAVFAYYYFAERKGYVLFFAYFYTFKLHSCCLPPWQNQSPFSG